MKLAFDLIPHEYAGKQFRIALDSAAKDPYIENLRREPRQDFFMKYILSRAAQLSRPLRFVDVGANVGAVSLSMAAHGMQVLSIEAVPQNFLALVVAARENGFRNLLPVNIAAFDTQCLVNLTGTTAATSIRVMPAGAPQGVAADTLQGILATFGFEDADIIKIDIEGAEMAALTGMDELLTRRGDLEVIYESNDHTACKFGHDQQALGRIFEKQGYSLYGFYKGGMMPMRAGDATPSYLIDILATKRDPAEIRAMGMVVRPLTETQLMETLLREATSGHPFRRDHVRRQGPYLPAHLKELPLWATISDCLEAPAKVPAP